MKKQPKQLQYAEQCGEWILNKIAQDIKDTFTGLKFILQGFRIFLYEILDQRT